MARTLGFTVTTTRLVPTSLTYCYADRVNQFTFNHLGDVFKCTVSKFETSDRLGFLDERGAIRWEGSSYVDWMAIPAVDDKCRACTYLPMCMGGCRKNRAETGKSSPSCTLPFAAMDVRVQQKYAESVAGLQ